MCQQNCIVTTNATAAEDLEESNQEGSDVTAVPISPLTRFIQSKLH